MYITMSEFRKDLNRYIELARTKEIVITRFGKPYVKLEKIERNNIDILNELAGSLPNDIDVEGILEQRLLQL